MKLKKVLRMVAILVATATFVGCGNLGKSNNDAKTNSNDEVVLDLWTYFPGLESVVESFEKENPKIKINIKEYSFAEYQLAYKKSLTKKQGDADLFMIDSTNYGEFNSIKGLEDLSKSDYTANNYKNDYDQDLWELGKSLDKKQLLGIPIASAPIVTYYRADILEKNGFPSDPDQLSEFMKNKDNWIKMGKTLSQKGIYTVQWVSEIVKMATSNMPYFNEKLEYQRDNDTFKNAVGIAKEASNSGLSAFTDIWSEKGASMLKDDKIAMLYLGSWGANDLEAMVPEQKGKWRVTTLPFGVYGWNNSSIISMAANSSKKDAAWKFIEYYSFKLKGEQTIGSVRGYIPFRTTDGNLNSKNEFLGGQEEQKLYEKVMALTKEYSVTPLDDQVFKIWDDIVNKGINEDFTDDQIMDNIRKKIDEDFKTEKDLLLKEMKNK